jgi:hypothetical protein
MKLWCLIAASASFFVGNVCASEHEYPIDTQVCVSCPSGEISGTVLQKRSDGRYDISIRSDDLFRALDYFSYSDVDIEYVYQERLRKQYGELGIDEASSAELLDHSIAAMRDMCLDKTAVIVVGEEDLSFKVSTALTRKGREVPNVRYALRLHCGNDENFESVIRYVPEECDLFDRMTDKSLDRYIERFAGLLFIWKEYKNKEKFKEAWSLFETAIHWDRLSEPRRLKVDFVEVLRSLQQGRKIVSMPREQAIASGCLVDGHGGRFGYATELSLLDVSSGSGGASAEAPRGHGKKKKNKKGKGKGRK